MSDRLQDIFDVLNEEGDIMDDDPDDGDYELYLDPEDIDDEMEDDEDDDDEEVDEDEEDDEADENADPAGEDDDEGITIQIDPNDEDSGAAFLEFASLLNRAGANDDARTSLLARLLASGGFVTRGGSRSAGSRFLRSGNPLSLEERQRREAEARRKAQWWTPVTKPDPRGVELLKGGEFGRVGMWSDRRMRRRPRGGADRALKSVQRVSQATIPNTNGTEVAIYPSVPYVGQYAKQDYSIFFTATQDFTVHLYDLSASRIRPRRPRRPNASGGARSMPGGTEPVLVDEGRYEEEEEEEEPAMWGRWGPRRRGMMQDETSLKKIKNVQGETGSWTITDCDSTRDGERMIYSSITPYVHLLHTAEHDAEHTCLDFSGARRSREDPWRSHGFGIWSIRFSADGKEVVAGAGRGRIMVYDIAAQERSLSILGHEDDVNAVCFADESSTNILVSGSDDGYVKIWDRRSLSGGTPSGVLVGATEGITYTSPKGDGRYVVVNSKDQAARLYDLRKMRSWSEFQSEPDAVSRYGQSSFDYRDSRYPPPTRIAHPKDCSVMTYRGHAVLRTLIRCHFSPRESTGQSYIYSGSADGMIHIWSLDGRVVQVLDRSKSLPLRNSAGQFNDPSAPEASCPASESTARSNLYRASSYCTRDVSWHGYEPSLMSTSWEVGGGTRGGGSIAKHEWKGLGKGGLTRLEDWVERAQGEAA